MNISQPKLRSEKFDDNNNNNKVAIFSCQFVQRSRPSQLCPSIVSVFLNTTHIPVPNPYLFTSVNLNFSPCEIITTVQCDTDKDSNHITGEEHVSTDISRYK